METIVRKIGNSLGVLLPKALLSQIDIANEHERIRISVKDGQIIIEKIAELRQGWEDAIVSYKKKGMEEPADEFIENAFDKEEWEW